MTKKFWNFNRVRDVIIIILMFLAIYQKIEIKYIQHKIDNITIKTAEINSLKANLTEINNLVVKQNAEIQNLRADLIKSNLVVSKRTIVT